MPAQDTIHQEYVTTGKPYSGGLNTIGAGSLFHGPENFYGTATLPTDATSSFPNGYYGLGYISQDGLSNTPSAENASIKAWNGQEVINYASGYAETYSFKCIELKPVVLQVVWGNERVSGTRASGMTVTHSRYGFGTVRVFCALIVHVDGSISRHVIPRGKLQSVDAIAYKDDEPIGYQVTIAALPGGFSDDVMATAREYISAPGVVNVSGSSGGSGSGGSGGITSWIEPITGGTGSSGSSGTGSITGEIVPIGPTGDTGP